MSHQLKTPVQDIPIKNLLVAKGIMPTVLQIEIADIVLEKVQHLSVEQILSRLSREGAVDVSKSSVVNTLRLFAQLDLVREVHVDDNIVFYDSNTSDHSHFYNADSGELVDINARSITINETMP